MKFEYGDLVFDAKNKVPLLEFHFYTILRYSTLNSTQSYAQHKKSKKRPAMVNTKIK